jgi:hypothetical protein
VIRPLSALTATAFVAVGLLAAPRVKTEPVEFINLKGHTTGRLDENLHSDRYPGNDLKGLKTGKQKLEDYTFEIGEGLLQLGSAQVEKRPTKIEGIKVGRKLQILHFLHGCGYSAEDDAVIGKYVVHYEDKTKAEIEIVYGKDVVDWWAYPGKAAPAKGKIVWESENEASKGFDAKIRLYVMTWENPHPDKKVMSLDMVATKPEENAAPFCVAITVADK